MNIVVVEDSLSIRAHLRSLISEVASADVVAEAECELEAINQIIEHNPDVVVLDINLKNGTGIEVLRYIREKSYGGKVIVMTNYAFPQYEKKCMELGADYFLDKCKDIYQLSGLLGDIAKHSDEMERQNVKHG
ncbi:MAG: response regulator transcription factor [Chromatiales bacterium]|nr:response regulator transcription factor [Chromatiales bacterium]